MIKKSRAIFALTIILMIIFLMQTIAQVTVVDANPFSSLSLGIKSPENRVYNTTLISVIFNVNAPIQSPKIVKMSYSLDGSSNRTLGISSSESSRFGTPMVFYVGTGILRNLGNGTHSLEVYALDSKGQTMTYPTGRIFMINATSSSSSEQPFAASNLTIALVISIIVIVIGAGLAVFAYKKRKPNQQVKA
jgi:hypothetical protein